MRSKVGGVAIVYIVVMISELSTSAYANVTLGPLKA